MSLRNKYSEYPKVFRESNIQREKERHKSRSEKEKKKKRNRVIIAFSFISAVLLFAGIFFFARYQKGKKELMTVPDVSLNADALESAFEEKAEKPVLRDSGSVVEYNGKTYLYNESVTAIAFIGIDKSEFGLEKDAVGTAGQADVIAVAVYNAAAGKLDFLVIPRDSMVDIEAYDTKGEYVGILKKQICLSFAYGDGKEKSCKNVLDSVGRLLFNLPVSHYVAMDLDGIGALNDAAGGITLTSTETIAAFEKDKEYHLWGRVAEDYVRERNTALLDSDVYRRARQKQYSIAFAEKFTEMSRHDIRFLSDFYEIAKQYIITNFTRDETMFLATDAITKGTDFSDFVTVPGKYVKGETYAEYEVDYTALFETALSLFYIEQQ